MQSHYEILKVPRDASQAEIKAAFRRMRSEHHPDRNKDPNATRMMQLINEAWEVLSNPQKRAKHDEELKKRDAFEDFLKEVEEQVARDYPDECSSQEDDDAYDAEYEAQLAKLSYFKLVSESWLQKARSSKKVVAPEPLYTVYRTEFLVGIHRYYYYAIDRHEVVSRWGEVAADLGPEVHKYSSGRLSKRLIKKYLLDEILSRNGVLWCEGLPDGDVTDSHRRMV